MVRSFKSRPRIAIVGAGAIGLACARALLVRGVEVVVFDRNRAGQGASWAAAGMLAPAAEALEEGTQSAEAVAFGLESLAVWPDWAAELSAETGVDLSLRMPGALLPVFDVEEAAGLPARAEAARALGAAVDVLDAAEARAREPALHESVRGALHMPGEGVVDPRALCAALAASVRSHGGALVEHAEVQTVEPGPTPALAVRGEGETSRKSFDLVVIASGWRAGALASVAPPLDAVVPVKGQLLAVDASGLALGGVIRRPGVYVIPRPDGRIIIGATAEPGRSDLDVDPVASEALHAAAAEIVPALADAPVVDGWTGVRPGLAASHAASGPIVAWAAENVLAAVGHYRNGVLLAPATGARIAEMAAAAGLTED
ncbi:MAG: glycine oxidase ThiO [Maricaulaceae bacterium]|jgi:glycine oxidase